ncbi:hypothetical protein PGTUg99_033138 [Puccinia graminis f. sp. tritici]|uniref:Uncharacterized protein n=1 Tax=Puccinia graminis f. sp. tritici TaxID=56615 RepID=A0A5B0QUM7_PUCGR|nr:hypothetical protein PGTUg99_033138 [Puccinia graminis f. sp. tritici]
MCIPHIVNSRKNEKKGLQLIFILISFLDHSSLAGAPNFHPAGDWKPIESSQYHLPADHSPPSGAPNVLPVGDPKPVGYHLPAHSSLSGALNGRQTKGGGWKPVESPYHLPVRRPFPGAVNASPVPQVKPAEFQHQ